MCFNVGVSLKAIFFVFNPECFDLVVHDLLIWIVRFVFIKPFLAFFMSYNRCLLCRPRNIFCDGVRKDNILLMWILSPVKIEVGEEGKDTVEVSGIIFVYNSVNNVYGL